MIEVWVNGRRITQYVKNIVWSGNIKSAARVLKADILGPRPETGDKVLLEEDGKELFTGMVMYADITEEGASFEAADFGIYLMKNKVFREYVGTADAIAARVLAELGVPKGVLARGSKRVKVTAGGDRTAYEVIMKAYMEDGVKRRFFTRMDGRELSVLPLGGVYAGSISEEIASACASEDVRDMVNKVAIVTRKGVLTGSVEDAAARAKYGTFQETRSVIRKKDNVYEARLMLSGVKKSADIAVLGRSELVSGSSVNVEAPAVGLSGRYLITADTHILGGAAHETKLTLEAME